MIGQGTPSLRFQSRLPWPGLHSPKRLRKTYLGRNTGLNKTKNHKMKKTSHNRGSSEVAVIFLVILIVLGVFGGGCYGYPKYKIYKRGADGQAELKAQEFERLIMVEDAKARMASAEMLGKAKVVAAEASARAEVARAHGVAEANEIIAAGLGGPEGYLRYLWIQGLQDGSSEVIYVPTEAGLPLLEAGKR